MQLASGGAFFKYLNTGTEGKISPEVWEIERIGTVCHDPKDFGEILKFIEKQCEINDNCKFEMLERVRKEIAWLNESH